MSLIRPPRFLRVAAVLLAAAAPICFAPVSAQADEAVEARMRTQLRQAVTESRQLQAENATLKLELDKARQQLAARPPADAAGSAELESLRQGLQAEQAHSRALQAQLEQGGRVLAEWRESHGQAVALARERDAEARKFEALYRELDAHVASCEESNATLVQISEQLLDRYRDKGVVEAAREAEPLLGLQRVELERLAQEYHHRIVDATIEPRGDGPAPVPAQTPAQSQ